MDPPMSVPVKYVGALEILGKKNRNKNKNKNRKIDELSLHYV